MIYMTPQDRPPSGLDERYWGQILTPRSRISVPALSTWCADSGAFKGNFSWPIYSTWLEKMRPHRHSCLFVTCPDKVADAAHTLQLHEQYASHIQELGYPVALVAQDGLELLDWPDNYDVLFIGGTTDWKLSKEAEFCISVAQNIGKHVHVGRVNSQKRISHFQELSVDSVDGTAIIFHPGIYYRRIDEQLKAFSVEDSCLAMTEQTTRLT